MMNHMDGPEFSLSQDALLEHSAWVRRIALDLVRDPGAADDLVQETWLAFLRAKPDLSRPLRPWLARVLRNAAALGARRRSGGRARERSVAREEAVPSSHELVERAEEQRRLVGFVLALKDPYRSTLLLRYYEGLTPNQIARVRGLPGATVRTHLSRGLAEMRERLDGEHKGDRKAWMVMLKPWFQEPTPAAGGAAALVVGGIAVALLALFMGFFQGTSESEAAVPEGLGAELASNSTGGNRVLQGAEPGRGPVDFGAETMATRSLQLLNGSGRPLRHYLVRVDGRDLISNDKGVIHLDANAESLLPVDDPGLAVQVLSSHDQWHRAPPVRQQLSLRGVVAGVPLWIATGPEYRLRVSGARTSLPDQLEATLSAWGRPNDQLPIQIAPVRMQGSAFGGPWVRFAGSPEEGEEPRGEWRLELRDAQGFWFGSTQFEALPISSPKQLEVALMNTAILEGHVFGIQEKERDAIKVLLLDPEQTDGSVNSCVLDADGRFSLRWIQSGAYSLRVLSPHHEYREVSVVLTAGEHATQNIQLDPVVSAGRVAGSIRSESGSYAGQLLVYLLDESDETLDVFPTTWAVTSGGDFEASFLFESTAPGDLHLDVVSLADAVTFDSVVGRFRAPYEGIELTLQDQVPAADWSFDVVDGSTGQELTEFAVTLRVPLGVDRTYQHSAGPREPGAAPGLPTWTLSAGALRWNKFTGPAPLRAFPSGLPFAWVVSAPGYRDFLGGSQAFEAQGRGRMGVHVSLTPND